MKNRAAIIILNKIDVSRVCVEKKIMEKYCDNIVLMSMKTRKGFDELIERMKLVSKSEKIESDGELLVINARHRTLIYNARMALEKAIETLKSGMPVDVVAIYMKEILEELGKITGETVTDDVISEIFSKFCLGK